MNCLSSHHLLQVLNGKTSSADHWGSINDCFWRCYPAAHLHIITKRLYNDAFIPSEVEAESKQCNLYNDALIPSEDEAESLLNNAKSLKYTEIREPTCTLSVQSSSVTRAQRK